MRPLSLTVRGFRSYAGEHTFDFRGRRLVGVVGPIGSGKSSLLDAMSFALYGKTPTVQRDTKGLINQRHDAAHVELWFQVGDQRWRAVRALRRRGQSEHALYRHEQDDPNSARLEEVLQDRSMTERVVHLLGLDFKGFRRSVLLAQNQFAEFLQAPPADRDQVLKAVFGFDTVEVMQTVARRRRDAAARDLEELEHRRQAIEQDRVALDEAQAAREALVARRDRLADATGPIASADDEIRATAAAEEAAAERRAALEETAVRLPDRARAEELVDAATKGAVALADAEAAMAAATAAFETREAELAAALEGFGGREGLARARSAVERLADRAEDLARRRNDHAAADRAAGEAATGLATAEREAEQGNEALRAAQDAATAAAARLAAAREMHHEAQHADMAATLRRGLQRDEPCPVCRQVVTSIPARVAAPKLTAARKDMERAMAKADKAAATAAKAATTAARRAEELAAARQRADLAEEGAHSAAAASEAAAATHAEAAGAVVRLLGDGPPQRLLEESEQRVREAETSMEAARRAAGDAGKAVDEARRAVERSQRELGDLAAAAAAAGGRLAIDLEPPGEPADIAAAVAVVHEAWRAQMAAAADAAAEAAKQRAELEARRGDLLEALELPRHADLGSAVAAAAAAVAASTREIELLETRVARFAALEAENSETVARLDTYRRLTDELAPSKFLRYLLDEERAALAALGSERFAELTGDRYRFTPGGAFDVVDLAAADAVRPASSLSGGETFLASLALALALAEMVGRTGGRLDAFFLDEGFGSLDGEHLDLAMAGIERLVAGSDRLVVLVSHVPELRVRLEDLIELDKDPVTGSTRVVAEAVPPG